jgi:putative two-component system protein, hydrogenase maturation factor HypX/HoxX
MHILFITSAHNSLSQRLAVELGRRGHSISVCVGHTGAGMIEAVARFQPDLIVAPMLKTAIPEEVWRQHRCLIVHPGIKGDRGPSSLDWALSMDVDTWGVTVLQADAEMDAGPIWATETFRVPEHPTSKSGLYRAEVTEAAVRAVLTALSRVQAGSCAPEPLDYSRADVTGELRPAMRQRDRAIDWSADSARTIARKIRAADSSPGVSSTLLGQDVFLYGAHQEARVSGPAGEVIGRRDGAVCVGTVDSAVWITHLKSRQPDSRYFGIKLPAAQVLGRHVRAVPVLEDASYREIQYWEQRGVGYLSFDFFNGAMSTDQCRRLRRAFVHARSRPTQVICLLGGRDFWSNGIHLNVIEAAPNPARESWRNITAIDDLILEILSTPRQLVVAGLRGNAGAGGVMLALAADYVYARSGLVLNPHYKTMGNLYGSEYWTYTLPRRVGAVMASVLTEGCQPIGADTAFEIGLVDDVFGANADEFERQLRPRVRNLAQHRGLSALLAGKRQMRMADERIKPLASYRAEELARMADNFFGPDVSYHEARHHFVHKATAPYSAAVPAPLARARLAA